jgi:DHA2 family methylenomycin A resistance protein-like MFS transporter
MGIEHDKLTTFGSGINLQRRSTLALITVCVGYFMVLLDTMVVNVALPAIASNLDASLSSLQWIVDA